MLQLNAQAKVIFYPKPVNLHKSFDSFMHLVVSDLKIELTPNIFILFANVRKNRIKILYHDGQHLMLFYTRFEHALHFSYQEGIIFDQVSFDNFIQKPNPKSRKKK